MSQGVLVGAMRLEGCVGWRRAGRGPAVRAEAPRAGAARGRRAAPGPLGDGADAGIVGRACQGWRMGQILQLRADAHVMSECSDQAKVEIRRTGQLRAAEEVSDGKR